MRVTFFVNGKAHALDAPPLRRLLDVLREDLGLTGSKEGCGEGECGACAVLIDGRLVNSCLVPVMQLAGVRITTIEGLDDATAPDMVEQAFLEEGAVQCGFCIPGMVIAAHALLDRTPSPSRDEIRNGLAGNLCRCTGYERIFRAVERAAAHRALAEVPTDGGRSSATDPHHPNSTADGPGAADGKEPQVFSPTGVDEALRILSSHGPGIRIVAGATDLLAAAGPGLQDSGAILDVTRIPELHGVVRTNGVIEIGAATTLAEIVVDPLIRGALLALASAADLFGAAAIRNRATLGGNVMTASPAADTPPALIALDAVALLASPGGRREIPVRSFISGYRKTVRRDDELLTGLRIPIPADGSRQAFYKVGPRRAQSIAKVSVAGRARIDAGGYLMDVRLAAGSVAPTPILLESTQAHLEGRKLSREVLLQAVSIAAAEVRPIDDVRSTEVYRREIAGRLIGRFLEGFLT